MIHTIKQAKNALTLISCLKSLKRI